MMEDLKRFIENAVPGSHLYVDSNEQNKLMEGGEAQDLVGMSVRRIL